ncbi:MAG: OmpA family protein [Myxococcota bacterium]
MAVAHSACGGCGPSYPDCDNDKNCKAHNEVCVDGKCKECRDDSACTARDACMSCQGNECLRRPGCCKSDVDCPGGRCNRDDGAATGTCGPQCVNNSDCPDGQSCVNGRCSAATGCTSDSQCPSGLKCKGGECTTECELSTVYFDFNEHAIRLDQESAVSKNADCLKSSSHSETHVEGHCDERGSDEYNLALGERRARSVSSQYKALGVKNLGRDVSFGEEKPVCGEANESCWKRNRRAETKVK